MKRKGSALVMITMILSLLMTTAILASVNSTSDADVTNKETIRTKLELACESGIRRAKTKVEDSFNNKNLTKFEPYVTFQDNKTDDTGNNPKDKIFADESFTFGTPGYYMYTYHSNENNLNIYVQYSIKEDNATNSWKRSSIDTTNKMNIEAIAYSPGYGWVGMKENVFAKRMTLFMYHIFYANDLEILPGPNFNLTGLIHTNQNLYLNSDNTLTISTDSLSAAGNLIRGRLDQSTATGHVKITTGSKTGTPTEMFAGNDSTSSSWESIASSKWAGTVKDKSLGASVLEPPKLESFQPGGYYDKNAAIKVEVITAAAKPYKITFNGITTSYTSAELGGALAETQIYDYKEYPSGSKPAKNTAIKATNIDINLLKTKLGYTTGSGLVYMTRDDAVPDNDGNDFTTDINRKISAFKVINGATLSGPTTFISNLPVYIQGSYNKHTSTTPSIDKWQPSAVVADAVTLLSDSWSDAKSNWKDPTVNKTSGQPMPVAVNGEYNVAFITGNLPTKVGQYNGGLENLPHFLENWAGKQINISGSFIQLYRSKYATGQWNGTYYQAPTRVWQEEDRFSDLNNLPPEYVNLFPSVSIGIIYSGWSQINKQEATLIEAH
ncbi:MAG: hypothetical protein WCK67_04270 [bacterium]